ncbi:MAG: PD40 domain-containing protein [Acidobacteriia bacterium]|nr:PD40 domain-containing protein [Terriglobia bacterium]
MNKSKVFVALLATLLTTPVHAQKSSPAEILLESARQKETLEGDLKGAIHQYEDVVKRFPADRSTVAKALVRMAEAHQKLGDAEAQMIFERVVRDYSDQKEPVDQARARLALLRPKPTSQGGVVNRVAWTVADGGWIEGKISPDGRYIPYVHYKEGGNLFLRDLVSGTDRQLTNTGTDGRERAQGVEYQCAHGYAFSRDGKQLVYSWHRGDTRRFELRVVNLQGSSLPTFRRLFDHEEVTWIMPHDWSPDGKWIAVLLTRKDKTAQIGLVSAQDGSLRVLKSIDWRGPNAMYFSPDGQYLAYDLPAGETLLQRDILVLAVDGSREIPAEVHPSDDSFLGWAPDGKRLLFASDRGGSRDLWARQFSDGKPQGQPELLKRDIGRFDSMGITSSGSLHYAVAPPVRGFDIRTAEFDFGKGDFVSPPVQAVSTYVGNNSSPDWAPDGKHFAWVSRRTTPHFVIGIRSTQTGQVRELLLPPNFYVQGSLSWGHDGNSFLVGGVDKGRSGVFRVDRESGRTSLVVDTQQGGGRAIESPDGGALYYVAPGSNSREVTIVKRILASGQESVLLKGLYGLRSLSRDGRYLAVDERTRSRIPQAVLLVPTNGKAPRELSRVNEPQSTVFLTWMPDQQSVLIGKQVAAGKFEKWRIPIDGGEPKQFETKAQLPGGFLLHPDGRQILFQALMPSKRPEVWVLENFLPSLSAKK